MVIYGAQCFLYVAQKAAGRVGDKVPCLACGRKSEIASKHTPDLHAALWSSTIINLFSHRLHNARANI